MPVLKDTTSTSGKLLSGPLNPKPKNPKHPTPVRSGLGVAAEGLGFRFRGWGLGFRNSKARLCTMGFLRAGVVAYLLFFMLELQRVSHSLTHSHTMIVNTFTSILYIYIYIYIYYMHGTTHTQRHRWILSHLSAVVCCGFPTGLPGIVHAGMRA